MPAGTEGGDPERSEELLARVSREVEKRVDLGDRHLFRAGRELDDLVPGLHIAFFEHPEVEAGAAMGDEQSGNARVVHPDPDAVAGDTGLRHLEDGRADPEAVADAHAVVGQSLDREVLAELPVHEVVSSELALPVPVRLDLVDEDRALLASVAAEIALAVAVDVELAHPGDLFRYPVKGLTPEPLPRVVLGVGETLPADRRYAIENGPSGFDPADPKWMSKAHFLMLMRDEWLAALRTHFDDANHILTISRNGAIAAQGDLETAAGRTAIERFFATGYARAIKGPPKVLSGDGHSFSDVARKVVSIINLSSLAEIENMVGMPVHPLRFRANLYVTGWPPWHEFELFDRTIAIGDARLRVVEQIVRCAAVNVDPQTAARDLNIPQALMRRLGHADCGVYAEVTAGGAIGIGDAIVAEQPRPV